MRATSVMRFVIYGAVGFCVGWAVTGFINTVFTALFAPLPPLHLPLPLVERLPYLSWFFAGAFGGAALGLANSGVHLGKLVAPFAILLVALAFSHLLYPCSPDERAILTEFSQSGGEEVTDADEGLKRGPNPPIEWTRWVVGPHPVRGWGCGIGYYDSPRTPQERLAYYRQELKERDWRLGRLRSERGGGGICCQSFYAYRGGYRYWVYADSIGSPQPRGHLLVEVTRVGLPRPGWLPLIA
jgi:hypothetical protein